MPESLGFNLKKKNWRKQSCECFFFKFSSLLPLKLFFLFLLIFLSFFLRFRDGACLQKMKAEEEEEEKEEEEEEEKKGSPFLPPSSISVFYRGRNPWNGSIDTEEGRRGRRKDHSSKLLLLFLLFLFLLLLFLLLLFLFIVTKWGDPTSSEFFIGERERDGFFARVKERKKGGSNERKTS